VLWRRLIFLLQTFIVIKTSTSRIDTIGGIPASIQTPVFAEVLGEAHYLLDVDFAETMAKTCITVLKQVPKRIQNYRIMASFLRPSEENEHILVQLKGELDSLEAWTMEMTF
jgi:hypothetical protein